MPAIETAKWEVAKGTGVTYHYLLVNSVVVACVEKWNDSRSTKNPFKVMFSQNGKFEPAAAFWTKGKVSIKEGETHGGYFIDYYGDLAKAKEYAIKNFALDNSRKFVGA